MKHKSYLCSPADFNGILVWAQASAWPRFIPFLAYHLSQPRCVSAPYRPYSRSSPRCLALSQDKGSRATGPFASFWGEESLPLRIDVGAIFPIPQAAIDGRDMKKLVFSFMCVSHSVPKSFCPVHIAGDQAGCIVAWSTKLAMHPRIWKWDAISTYLLKTAVYAVTPLCLFCFHGGSSHDIPQNRFP